MSSEEYSLFCITEGEYKYCRSTSPPIACPLDYSHTIDSSTINISPESVTDVRLVQEREATDGKFKLSTLAFTVPANTTTESSISFPYPVNVSNLRIMATADNIGDIVSFSLRSFPAGSLTSDVTNGNSTINVDNPTLYKSSVGYILRLYDGTNTDIMGAITSFDTSTGQVNLETPSANDYSTSNTNVGIEAFFMDNVEIGTSGIVVVGGGAFKSFFLPANTSLTCSYKNNSSTTAKRVVALIECLY